MRASFLLLFSIVFPAAAAARFSPEDSVRIFDIRSVCMLSPQWIAIHQGQSIPAGFTAQGLIDRVKKAGYKYIVAAIPTKIWDWGSTPARWNFYCDAKSPARVEYAMIKEAFETCRANGLQFIPAICMSNRHSGPAWDFTEAIELSSHVAREFDVTGDRRGTVSCRGGGPENKGGRAFDDNPDTKWFDASKTSWIQYDFEGDARHAVGRYTVTSAADAPERDPADWQLSGSNDGSNWTVLDAKTGQAFPKRKEKKSFDIPNRAAYAMYRFAINKVRDPVRATGIQCAGIELIAQTRYTATPLGPDRPGARGMDYYFSKLLERIRREFTGSRYYKPGDYIPFVHISHDEMHTWEDNYFLADSPGDRAWIAAHGNDAMAFKRLIVNELFRRTDSVRTKLGTKTKVIMFADMFDPELNGRLVLNTYLKDAKGNPVTLTLAPEAPAAGDTSIADLPGLTPAQKDTLKKRLILSPWWYRVYNHSYNPPREYDNNATLAYLTKGSRAFRIIFCNAFDDPLYDNDELIAESCLQIKKQAALKRNYRKFILGFNASVYPCWAYTTCPGAACPCGTAPFVGQVFYWDHDKDPRDQPRAYDIIEFVSGAHALGGGNGPE